MQAPQTRSGRVAAQQSASAPWALAVLLLQGPGPPGLEVGGHPGIPQIVPADAEKLAHDEALFLGAVLRGWRLGGWEGERVGHGRGPGGGWVAGTGLRAGGGWVLGWGGAGAGEGCGLRGHVGKREQGSKAAAPNGRNPVSSASWALAWLPSSASSALPFEPRLRTKLM